MADGDCDQCGLNEPRRRLLSVQLVLNENDSAQDLLEGIVSDTTPTPEEAFFKQEFAERLARATSRLSPALRITFQLQKVDGLSTRENCRHSRGSYWNRKSMARKSSPET